MAFATSLFLMAVLVPPTVAMQAPELVTGKISPLQLFQRSCSDLTDYDSLHSTNLANGWSYVGTADVPIATAISAIGAKTVEGSQIVAADKLAPLAGALLGMLLTEGHHRRVYTQGIGNKQFILTQSFDPGAGNWNFPAQVNCALRAVGQEHLDSNEELNVAFGGKANHKENAKRKPGERVLLRWDLSKRVFNVAYWPPGVPLKRDGTLSEHGGVVTFTKVEPTKKFPTSADPEVTPSPSEISGEQPDESLDQEN